VLRIAATIVITAAILAAGCEKPAPKRAAKRQAATEAKQAAEAEKPETGDPSAPSLVDNGDGTLTDQKTGLIWEKKCDCAGTLHDMNGSYRWSADGKLETVWDWITRINAESADGFAGHDDWRVPNVKELLSLADYDSMDPAVPQILNACDEPCTDVTGAACSCTTSGAYWTSTTFADFPAHALVIDFTGGTVDDQLKTRQAYVRAVRGPAK
jgi:hypothetical protein